MAQNAHQTTGKVDAAVPQLAPGGLHERLLDARRILVEADHLSHVNKYLPWRYPLGSLAMAAVAALLCGWFIHVQAFTLLVGVLSVIVLGLIWPWVSLRCLRGTLSFEQSRTVEGRPVTAKLRVRNFLPVAAWGLKLYGGSGGWVGVESLVNLAAIPGWRTTEFTLPFVPPARGEYPVGEACLGTGFPFGLWEARRALTTEGRLIAWPATFDPGPVPEAAASDRTREGLVYQNRSGNAGDFLGVRPYVRGDQVRRIHWQQTAKRGELMIREQQASANVSLQVVLDVDPSVHRGSGSRSSREWAIRTAGSLIRSFLGRGALVELVVGDVVVPVGSGDSQRQKMLEALARVPDGGAVPLEQLLTAPAARRFGSGLQAVITTDLGAAAVPPALLRRHATHLIVFCARAFDESVKAVDIRPYDRAWIEINTSDDVPEAFRRAWREVLSAN